MKLDKQPTLRWWNAVNGEAFETVMVGTDEWGEWDKTPLEAALQVVPHLVEFIADCVRRGAYPDIRFGVLSDEDQSSDNLSDQTESR